MAIIYDKCKKIFALETLSTKYVFKLVDNKYLIHCYYGQKVDDLDLSYNVQAFTFSPLIENVGIPRFSLNDAPLEFSYFGSSDFRASSLKIKNANGDSCTLFKYKEHKIVKGKKTIKGLPYAKNLKDVETLELYLEDEVSDCKLTLYYSVFPQYDVITRYFTVSNKGKDTVKIQKAMPICLDLPGHDYSALTLYGCQTTERNIQYVPLHYGNYSIASRRGASSHNFNPFLALLSQGANEESGEVYAFNIIFSGCFLDEIEVDSQGNTRVGIGLGEENFAYSLKEGEEFFSPEGVLAFSAKGLGGLSRKMHSFIRDSILPPDNFTQRPIVLNTWEACYFDINENLLLDFAKKSAECNIDMVVMDDGWFSGRNNDKAGLGDWHPDKKKFPNGLKGFVSEMKKSIMFGIWIEPEMVNPDSELYRAHPEWCLRCKNRESLLSRNQLVLDFCNPAVLDYLKKEFWETLGDVGIDYIKWDFNRNLSEVGSDYLSPEMQDEAMYRYQLGVYELLSWFKEKFPNAMIESCSGGGGRYDLGMMAYSTQIWTSDNTSAEDRVRIQYGTSIAYPSCQMSCHVSEPKEDMKNLDYKFKVAIAGMLGYEFNILKASQPVIDEIEKQIAFYKYVEPLVKQGELFRLISPFENSAEVSAYYYADKEENADRILLSYLQNFPYTKREISCLVDITPQKVYQLKISSADSSAVYREYNTGNQYSGSDLRVGIPIRMNIFGETGIVMLFEKI